MRTKMKSIIIACGICLGLLCSSALAADQMSIQVKRAQVRSKPGPLAKIEVTLAYGDRVNVLEEQTDWVLVEIPGSNLKGWVHRSALTQKKIQLSSGSGASSVSGDEIVLAGKGFNAQVEEQFKQQNQNLDYGWIDQMEQKLAVSQEAMRQFLNAGDLSDAGGAL